MDPNATLAQLREAIRRFRASPRISAVNACEIVELFEALDQWMTKGGFSPWQSTAEIVAGIRALPWDGPKEDLK